MEEFRRITVNDLLNKNSCMFGDSQEQRRTLRALVFDALHGGGEDLFIVFDKDGDIYEEFGDQLYLVDWRSTESVAPDCLAPVFKHDEFGRDIPSLISRLAEIFCVTKADKGSNDQFWTTSSKRLAAQHIYYAALMAREDYRVSSKGHNCLLSFARQTTELTMAMGSAAEGDSSGLLLGYEHRLQQAMEDDGAFWHRRLFEGTLARGSSVSSSSNTQRCILQSYESNASAFLAALRVLERNGADIADRSGNFDLEEFITGYTEKRILCVGNSGNGDADRGSASLLLLGAAAAAAGLGAKVNVLASDPGYWNILHPFERIQGLFPGVLNALLACTDLEYVARDSAVSKEDAVAAIEGKTELTFWHITPDVALEGLFASRGSVQNRYYELSQLFGGILVRDDRRGGLEYLTRGEPPVSEKKCVKRPFSAIKKKRAPLWYALPPARTEMNSPQSDIEVIADGGQAKVWKDAS
ncbi:MAG: hypothetical protein Q4D58_03760 [Synergistaceae bacterium]|nr:hypothetical protein [Synergistaceae bacterium]